MRTYNTDYNHSQDFFSEVVVVNVLFCLCHCIGSTLVFTVFSRLKKHKN